MILPVIEGWVKNTLLQAQLATANRQFLVSELRDFHGSRAAVAGYSDTLRNEANWWVSG
jgi:hypothetical protein